LDNVRLNAEVLAQVQGRAVSNRVLQVIDSGSFPELPFATIMDVVDSCGDRGIELAVLESHWMFHAQFDAVERLFGARGVAVKHLAGVETFHVEYREKVLCKGMGGLAPAELARHFQWVDLLYGLEGQSLGMLRADIEVALSLFERVLLNIFVDNTTNWRRDWRLTDDFYSSAFFDDLRLDPRVEILDPADSRAPDFLFTSPPGPLPRVATDDPAWF
jgi:hypothetical protein